MTRHSTVDISLRGREYCVACAPEERESLLAAVAHVEAQMNEIAARTKGSGERLAVMTALNLAHELLDKKKAGAAPVEASGKEASDAVDASNFDSPEIARRISSMVARMDAVMGQQENLL